MHSCQCSGTDTHIISRKTLHSSHTAAEQPGRKGLKDIRRTPMYLGLTDGLGRKELKDIHRIPEYLCLTDGVGRKELKDIHRISFFLVPPLLNTITRGVHRGEK